MSDMREAWPKAASPWRLRGDHLHGHRVSFQAAGSGDELVVLLHGITSTSDAWREVMPELAERYTVVAPDMIGHGRSAKPRGDYSLGAYAAGVRDLLAVLGFDRGTVVGHSFGGGIAMQFSYLFPEYVERMALISSGGLGREVHPLLRAAMLPASEWVLPLIAQRVAGQRRRGVSSVLPGWVSRQVPTSPSSPAAMPPSPMRAPATPSSTRCAASSTTTASESRALDRLYLADQLPTLFVWGDAGALISGTISGAVISAP